MPSTGAVGDPPRTSTGLIATSHRRTLDDLSSPEQWTRLPPRPPPEQFPFRGDYVNERNRRIVAKQHQRRRRAEAAQRRAAKENRSIQEGGGQPSKRVGRRGGAPRHDDSRKKDWDPYRKHDSCHRLSEEEGRRKDRTKANSLNYIRTMAAQRKVREEKMQELQHRLEEEVRTEMIEDDDCSSSALSRSMGSERNDANGSGWNSATIKVEAAPQRSPSTFDGTFEEDEIDDESAGHGSVSLCESPPNRDRYGEEMNEQWSLGENARRDQWNRIQSKAASMIAAQRMTDDSLDRGNQRGGGEESQNPTAMAPEGVEQELTQMRNQVQKLEEKLSRIGLVDHDQSRDTAPVGHQKEHLSFTNVAGANRSRDSNAPSAAAEALSQKQRSKITHMHTNGVCSVSDEYGLFEATQPFRLSGAYSPPCEGTPANIREACGRLGLSPAKPATQTSSTEGDQEQVSWQNTVGFRPECSETPRLESRNAFAPSLMPRHPYELPLQPSMRPALASMNSQPDDERSLASADDWFSLLT